MPEELWMEVRDIVHETGIKTIPKKKKCKKAKWLSEEALLPGASTRNPARDKVMRKEAWQNARTWSGFRGSPWNFLSIHLPKKIRICLLFHFSDILWKKSNQGFSLLHLKGMFQLNPSDSSLACLTGSPTSFTACELLTAPPTQPQEAQSLKAS